MSTGADVLAHSVHYAVLAAGLVGLLVLLGPRFTSDRNVRRDPHDERVLALRRQLERDALAPAYVDRTPSVRGTAPARERAGTIGRLLLPIAVASSTAAAGVHAAAGPAHFHERTLFGLFFAGSALLQILWSVVVAAHGTTRPLLRVAVVGNLAVVALWLATRTYGLPFGLLPEPEAVGPWDVACAVWEVAIVVSCVMILRRGSGRHRLLEWSAWSTAARAWALWSVAALVLLVFSGSGS